MTSRGTHCGDAVQSHYEIRVENNEILLFGELQTIVWCRAENEERLLYKNIISSTRCFSYKTASERESDFAQELSSLEPVKRYCG